MDRAASKYAVSNHAAPWSIGSSRERKNEEAGSVAEALDRTSGSRASYIVLGAVFLVGLALLLYPTVSDYWNSFHQSRAIMSYAESVSGISEEEYAALFREAEAYNEGIRARKSPYVQTEREKERYQEVLNIGGNGIMGYVEIPVINVSLPIYHGTSESVLQVAIGHLEWSFLPIGGLGTHCVLSGHRGLPSAKLFTDLDRLVEGDVFMLYVLNEVLTYEVDQILIVLPEEISSLQAVPEKDYCTLVTCTPYGINTHRLLVRGHRIANIESASSIRVSADGIQVEPVLVAPFLGIPLLLFMMVWLFADDRHMSLDLETEEDNT